MRDREAWEEEAARWVRFARAPGHDAYWYYRDAFFDEIVPPPTGPAVEVGCGEGGVTRDLVARGHRVVAVDGSATLVRHAGALDQAQRYALAEAGRLPLRSRSVALAVAYNSLMDFDDLPAAVSEVGRVLVDGGAFCVCITHPLQDAGGFVGEAPEAAYVVRSDYFATRRFDATVERDGISFRFRGWTRPMEDYFEALFGAGFVIDALREPRPDTADGRYARWQRVPMFLLLRAIRRRPAGPPAGSLRRRSNQQEQT